LNCGDAGDVERDGFSGVSGAAGAVVVVAMLVVLAVSRSSVHPWSMRAR
jgi:hypothetical protein